MVFSRKYQPNLSYPTQANRNPSYPNPPQPSPLSYTPPTSGLFSVTKIMFTSWSSSCLLAALKLPPEGEVRVSALPTWANS